MITLIHSSVRSASLSAKRISSYMIKQYSSKTKRIILVPAGSDKISDYLIVSEIETGGVSEDEIY
jgi:hypothetical protein